MHPPVRCIALSGSRAGGRGNAPYTPVSRREWLLVRGNDGAIRHLVKVEDGVKHCVGTPLPDIRFVDADSDLFIKSPVDVGRLADKFPGSGDVARGLCLIGHGVRREITEVAL